MKILLKYAGVDATEVSRRILLIGGRKDADSIFFSFTGLVRRFLLSPGSSNAYERASKFTNSS